MKKIFLISIILTGMVSCLPYYPKMKVRRITQIPVGTNTLSVRIVGRSVHSLSLPAFYYIKDNRFYVNDSYNKSLKVFSLKGELENYMHPHAFNGVWNPFYFVLDNDGNYYVENQSVSNYSGDASYFSDILKFDKKGFFIKKVATVSGALKKISINQYNYLTLIAQDLTNHWHVQRYINDSLIGDYIFFTNSISEIVLLDNDNRIFFESDEQKKSVYREYDILNHQFVATGLSRALDDRVLLNVDQNRILYFAENYNSKYIVIEKTDLLNQIDVKKICSIALKNKYGLFLDLLADNKGRIFQMRLADNNLCITEYSF